MEKIYYAGIGSRSITDSMYSVCLRVATVLAHEGWVLRSGGASGADTAFEQGCDLAHGEKEIYLPWKGFNENKSNLYQISPDAYDYAKTFHPAYSRLTPGAAKLIARDTYQVLGKDLKSPSNIIVYCAETDRKGVKGGTGQAVRIAQHHNIPVFNILDCYKLKLEEIILLIKGRLNNV
jgi:hypothetical protein